MKILIVTDAWLPQTNGVVRTLQATARELEKMGHIVHIEGPQPGRFTFSAPTYPEIKLELFASRRLRALMDSFVPDAIHIATEGPLGWAARALCLSQNRPFTTAYHTRFPEYLAGRVTAFLAPFIQRITYAVLRRFHAPACGVMVATGSMMKALHANGIAHTVFWSRGVDTDLFYPRPTPFPLYEGLARPILLYVGRVSVEKNLPVFLALRTTGTKVVVGTGPDEARLRAQYPDCHFLGRMEGAQLAHAYAAADLFVFPSQTDTFGLVLLEACASGLRVAAYPATGPTDLFAGARGAGIAVLSGHLQEAVDIALTLPQDPCLPRGFAETHSWRAAAGQFLEHLALCRKVRQTSI